MNAVAPVHSPVRGGLPQGAYDSFSLFSSYGPEYRRFFDSLVTERKHRLKLGGLARRQVARQQGHEQ